MDYRRLAVAALAPLALAACGGNADQANQVAASNASGSADAPSPAEAAAAIPVKAVFEPGQWETSSAITAVSMPGAPAEVTKRMVGKTTAFKHCMTETEANREPGEIFRKGAGADCKYERFAIADGKIDALMQCQSKDKGAALSTIEMTGSYDSTSYAVMTKMSVAGPGGQTIAMEAKANGRRTGVCSETAGG